MKEETSMTSPPESVCRAMQPLLKTAPWILRITERKPHTGPVLVICERYITEHETEALREYGSIYDKALRVSRPVVSHLLAAVRDDAGRVLGLDALLQGGIDYRGQIPLDTNAGAKLALFAKLHPQVRREDRIELMAWRIERFSREETLYWLSKVSISSIYGKAGIEWAKSGLRTMLAGHQSYKASVQKYLDRIRK